MHESAWLSSTILCLQSQCFIRCCLMEWVLCLISFFIHNSNDLGNPPVLYVHTFSLLKQSKMLDKCLSPFQKCHLWMRALPQGHYVNSLCHRSENRGNNLTWLPVIWLCLSNTRYTRRSNTIHYVCRVSLLSLLIKVCSDKCEQHVI